MGSAKPNRNAPRKRPGRKPKSGWFVQDSEHTPLSLEEGGRVLSRTGKAADTRIAKLFPNGRSQAVRIPAEFAFDTDCVVISRFGKGLLIEPAPARGLLALVASWEPLDEDFPEIEDVPPEAEEIF